MSGKLDSFGAFNSLDVTTREKLAAQLKSVEYKKNDFLVRPEQVQRNLYFVKKGVQFSYFETESKQHVVAFTYPPNLCAIPDSFNFQKPSRYYLQCLTDSEFEYITYEDLQHLWKESHALESLFRQLTEVILSGVINRHMELQTLTIEERFIAFTKRSPHLLQLVPHKLIASYLHIDATNFSKLYNTIKI